jgi:hypothetical protein
MTKQPMKTQTKEESLAAQAAGGIPAHATLEPNGDIWRTVDTLPTDSNAVFFVRANPKSKPMLVRYRKTRVLQDSGWVPFLKIVDHQTGVKIPFKPTEWRPATEYGG